MLLKKKERKKKEKRKILALEKMRDKVPSAAGGIGAEVAGGLSRRPGRVLGARSSRSPAFARVRPFPVHPARRPGADEPAPPRSQKAGRVGRPRDSGSVRRTNAHSAAWGESSSRPSSRVFAAFGRRWRPELVLLERPCWTDVPVRAFGAQGHRDLNMETP